MESIWTKEVLDQFPEGVIVMDQHRVILYINQIAKEQMGWKEGEKVPHCSHEASLHLYRVLQEAVLNAVRHGKAKQIDLLLEPRQTRLFFQVRDDGRGFKTEECTKGVGRYHMKERIEMLGGEIKWFSKIGGPTVVEGYIPLQGGEVRESSHRG